VRDKTGDIIVLGEQGAQAIIPLELVEYLETHLKQVRSVLVNTRRIEQIYVNKLLDNKCQH
jgi:RNA-binding protein YlmH